MYRPTFAEIDLGAIASNIHEVRRLVGPGVKICPAVKADAYGHGAVQVSRAVLDAGAEMLAVATIEEALELRESGIRAPILLLGCIFPDQAAVAVENRISTTVCDLSYARELSREAVRLGIEARAHIKIDTGMGRIGVQPGDALEFVESIWSLPGLEIEGIFTHFPVADEDTGFTEAQAREFGDVCESLTQAGMPIPIRHAANSPTITNIPFAHFDMVRPGIMVYGLRDPGVYCCETSLRPAMTLKTQVAFVKDLPSGCSVSYGRTFQTCRSARIATLPIGYADGYNRLLSNRGSALVHGRRSPVVGRVCMDQLMVDVTDIPDVAVGDEVVMYGRQGDETISIEEVASLVGTITYEITCWVSRRVPRVYKP